MTGKPVRVLSVDDHALLVEGLRALIDGEPDLEFVGQLATADGLTDHVQRAQVDVVLLDIDMPGPDAFEALEDLRRRAPAVRTILLSAHVRDQYIDAAYRAGAWGYLSKSVAPGEVVEGIRKVLRGELAFSADVMARSRAPSGGAGPEPGGGVSKLTQLTARERRVLSLIARGLSRTEIARELKRSPMTVDNHRKSIMRKLEIRDRAALVRYAMQEGLG